MAIVVIGSKGQLGSDLCNVWKEDAVGLTHDDIEIGDRDSVQQTLDSHNPSLVVNCAAYNKVDLAEDEPELANRINAQGPGFLAEYCAKADIPLVHVSTDYVFAGNGINDSAWTEDDEPIPNSAYGGSKRAGELAVMDACPKHYVIRTCGLYGHAGRAGNGNFVETMLRLGKARDELRVVDDQVCTPTFTAHLANWIQNLVTTNQFGLYHATNSGQTTWFNLAKKIMELAEIDVELIPITTEEFGAKANRPPFSVLDCSKLAEAINIQPRSWEEALAEYLEQRADYVN